MAMQRAIGEWKKRNSIEAQDELRLPYTIYGCMLLLPGNAFQTSGWRKAAAEDNMDDLYNLIAKYLNVTHIAINKPIPPTMDQDDCQKNVVRAPRNFLPIWGDFGLDTCGSPPNRKDFDNAFWATAKQNGIHQTWAPRWTMFSRGNISEKARLLTLPSLHLAIAQGEAGGRGCTAVDLYAGIGYFAFSYLKAGMSRVLCWDINPWSVEGFLRGAAANKWSAALYTSRISTDKNPARALVFNESNELAQERIQQLADWLPPVRHVNCGLLPTSQRSWETAFSILDRNLDGWIHVHENFDTSDIRSCVDGVKGAFQRMLNDIAPGRAVEIQGIHHVKSYAPGVAHFVIDVFIPALHSD